jgi:hypothetical protein
MNRDFNKFKRLNDLRKNKTTAPKAPFSSENRFAKPSMGAGEFPAPSTPETNSEGLKNHINGLFIAHSKAMLKSNDDILNCLQLVATNQSESINFFNEALSSIAETLAKINDSVGQLQEILMVITDETEDNTNLNENLDNDFLEDSRKIQAFTEDKNQNTKKK